MDSSNNSCIAIDLGGTKIAAALITDGCIEQRKQISTSNTATPEQQCDVLLQLIEPWQATSQRLAVAVSGRVDRDGHWFAVNLKTFHELGNVNSGYPLRQYLSERTGKPVTVLNDALAATWGEYRVGAGQGCEQMMYLTISTGVGGGFVLAGRLLTSASGLAGHLGFICADPQGPLCGSGRYGTLESIASGTALARQATEKLGKPQSAEQVFELAANNVAWAQDLMTQSTRAIAQAIADCKAMLDVDVVVIGGGVGLAPGYITSVQQQLLRLPELFHAEIKPAALGHDSALLGAALYDYG